MGGGWDGDRIEDGKDGGVEGKRQKRCWLVPEDLFPEDLFPEDLFRYTKTPFFSPGRPLLARGRLRPGCIASPAKRRHRKHTSGLRFTTQRK